MRGGVFSFPALCGGARGRFLSSGEGQQRRKNMARTYLFTSESVTEGHPDKICDQISDAVLDAILAKDPNGRVACETTASTGLVHIMGEITTSCYVDIPKIAREVIRDIGYDRAKYGFDCDTCGVMSLIHEQSPDIAQGVDESFETQIGATTDPIDLTIGYDTASLTTPGIRYTGPVTTDHYGRKVPKHAHGTRHLGRRTQSAKVILDAAMALFDRIVNPALLVRRVNIVALHILVGQEELPVPEVEQLDLFTDYAKLEQERLAEQARLERESRIQQAALSIKRKFGKNALVKGMDLQEDATAMTRNNQIGGHRA